MAADVSGHAYLTGEFDGAASFGVTNLTGVGGTHSFLARLGSETLVVPHLALTSSNGLTTVEVTGTPGSLPQIETTGALPPAERADEYDSPRKSVALERRVQ